MQEVNYSFGMIGLGTMGRSLLLNMADHDFKVAGYDKDIEKNNLLEEEGAGKPVKAFNIFPNYAADTWGPELAEALIAQDGYHWFTLPTTQKK